LDEVQKNHTLVCPVLASVGLSSKLNGHAQKEQSK